MRLLCDRMLGTLARWLRFMGYDVYYPRNDVDDEKIIELVQMEGRTLVTRDRVLARRVRGSILITSVNLDEQIRQVLASAGEPEDDILVRCGVCNSVLEPIEKSEVKGIVPDGVFQRQSEYMRCPLCRRIYWQGSHYEKIMAKISDLRKHTPQ